MHRVTTEPLCIPPERSFRLVLKLETVDCSIEGEEQLIYIQLTKHRNFQNEGSAIQQLVSA